MTADVGVCGMTRRALVFRLNHMHPVPDLENSLFGLEFSMMGHRIHMLVTEH